MEEITFIWYNSPVIWAAIISGVFALLSTGIAIALFKKKNVLISDLNKELETHKTALNIQLEKIRIQYGVTHTKRLDVLYEACERMAVLDNHINVFVSYHHYDCLPNLDFSDDCKKKEHACDKDCIVHYSDKIFDFRRYTQETSDFFEKNEMFFPLDTVNAHSFLHRQIKKM